MSNNFIDELFDNLRRDPFNNNPTNDTSYELQKDFLSDPQGPEGWIADGVITDVELVDGSTLVGKVDALPTLPDVDYPEGKVVYLTTNGKLYRNDSDVWTSAVPTVDLTGQITETQITDSSITTAKVAANAIVADKIASNAITTDKLNANAVTAAKIAAGTITATEIAASTITSAKMVAGTITAASGIIADAAITNAKIADATIQSAKIVNLTAEKITGGYYGILIQANTTGVDSAFGGQDNALIFSGLTVGNLGITGVGDAALYAPNSIYLDSEGTTYDPSLATSTANGVRVVGDDVVLIQSPQVMIGTTSALNSGDTIYISSAGVVVNGGLTSNSTLAVSGTGKTAMTLPDTTTTTGLTIGADTNLYRSAANTLTTDDNLVVTGSLTVGTTVIYGVPAGSVQAYLGAYTNIPTGWLFCDGTAVSRTTYAALFAVIGTTFGVGNGTTTFNLPNLFGHMLVGGTSTTTPGTASQTGSADSYLNATWDHDHTVDVASTTSSSDSHAHAVDPTATTSGGPSTTTVLNYSSGGTSATVATSTHTHSTNILSFTSGSDSHSHTVNPASVTSSAMTVSPTHERTRVNYIVKT